MGPQISQMVQMEKDSRDKMEGSETGKDYILCDLTLSNVIRDQPGFLYNRNFKWYGLNILWSVLF